MAGDWHCRRVDIIELKLQIEMRLGRQKTEHYLNLLSKYFSLKISKPDFDKLCIRLFGREGVTLHNRLIQAIIRNAHVSNSPPPKFGKGKTSLNVKLPNKYRGFVKGSIRTPTSCFTECEATELLSLSSRPPLEVTSVEEGEEIEQSPGIHSRSPLRAPLGVSLNVKGKTEMLSRSSSHFVDVETCCKDGELPDTSSLRKRLDHKLETRGLNVSTDYADLLNNGLDVFMKRLLKSCASLASSRSENEARSLVSMADVRVTRELNRQILRGDWPVLLEKILCSSEEYLE